MNALPTQKLGKSTAKKRIDHVQSILDEMDCDPIKGLAEICEKRIEGTNDYFYPVETRIPCLKELASYIAPKLRSVELSVDPTGGNINFNLVQFGEISNGKDLRNDSRHIEGGGHGPFLEPVHLHSERKPESESDEKADYTDITSDGSSEPTSDHS
jgi:hypothetical protein